MQSTTIETHHLTKSFGAKLAVADLSLEVHQGEVFGFLGPNGAGKTTAVKMLLGLIQPTGGKGLLLGSPLGDRRVRAQVGFLPEHFRFHDWLTAEEFLGLHARLAGVDVAEIDTRITQALNLVDLVESRHQQLRTFSKGMLQRIGLAQALIHEPQIVFLDEPTSGLDPKGRRMVRDITRRLRVLGTTVFLNSHLLSEVELTCDRVAFINHGRIVRFASLAEDYTRSIHLKMIVDGMTPDVIAALSKWGEDLRIDDDQINLRIESRETLPEINRYLVEQGVNVYEISPQRPTLEDLFLEVLAEDDAQNPPSATPLDENLKRSEEE